MKNLLERPDHPRPLTTYTSRLLFLLLLIVTNINASPTPQAFPPDQVDPKKLLKQADRMLRQASYLEAEQILRRLISAEPKNNIAKLKLAQVLLKQRAIVDAYELSFPIAVAEPKNSLALAVLGSVFIAAGRFADARPILLKAIQLNRKEALAWAGYGLIDFYENRIDEAVLNLREAVYHDPNHADFSFALGQITARAERYTESADAYQRFLTLSRETDDERRARIKGLITFLRYLGDRGSLYVASGAESTSIPFALVGNRPVLKIRINGKGEELNFILDTGSGISVISEETAERLKVSAITKGGLAKGIGGDGKFEIVYGFLNQMEIGEVKMKNVPVYIRRFHRSGHQVDGYIGLSVISKFLTTVDYGELKFELDRSNLAKDHQANATGSMPLRLTSSGFLSGEVSLDGLESPVNFIVDTGASVSVISEQLAAIDVIKAVQTEQRMRVVGAAGVTENVPAFLLPKISFGDHSRYKITAVALDLDLINEASGFEQGGILGGNFLRSYKLIFDFRNAKVFFDPIESKLIEPNIPLE